MFVIKKCNHGEKRSQQRGITDRKLQLIIQYGLCTIHKNKLVYYLRNKEIQYMVKQGVMNKQEADKLQNIFVITNIEDIFITAYHPTKRKYKRIVRLL